MTEIPLPGGFVNRVVRVGDTVRRDVGHNSDFAHRLLRRFEQRGWSGTPRYLGMDSQGREVLTYLDDIAGQPDSTDQSLVAVARAVREFHDLTAGTPLAADQDVVCHNDLSPKNTVYRPGGSVAFLDWDLAAPGARIHDIAHMCWQYLNLGPSVADVTVAANRMRLMCDAYGLADRTHVVDTILWWQDRCWRGIESAADNGDPAMVNLRNSGAVDAVRAAYDWTSEHRAEFATAGFTGRG
ncbi:hypothetical protein BJY24_000497 [Nocardia transvalensis]|uniref:Aminoglycoside phosphotransferase domain-containing protein n=1 Tax=Nocardia transvalensis TaxID=37333 RepID=A0A7W9P908_9NOCA|nr:phosphotransferase [Nocardia transvalensis]MBB5911630.1 hypothetical protein [Nocardia transvalensis]